ncbi:BON domain-containing protein [Thalassospira marina]|uniref:BON domain-containing protein n=1 Tax=Thalassospira marina TaxID=2048283 RepID=A0A2N3KVP4_9PROT|nr:BON domain-containing protein [Thalassospira marina]AUG54605.1 BON domain-containing protein [Thalassospira marina]PKR54614.1 BON domain-containing protein [Thalassospira marina]
MTSISKPGNHHDPGKTHIRHKRALRVCSGLFLATILLATGGCTSLVVGAGATAGVAAMQERGFKNSVSDNAINANLWRKYLEVDKNMFVDIEIEVVEGEVLLAGRVPSDAVEMKAVEIAWQTDGVKRVINQLQVGKEIGLVDTANDLLISTRIKTALMFDSRVYAINYNIETVDGTVYLMGIAQNRDELDRVISHVRATSYVKRVVNFVRLKDDPTRKRT